jgi:ribosome-associated protein
MTPAALVLFWGMGRNQWDDVILKIKLQKIIQNSLDENKAEDICVINLRGKSTIADHMIIATGRSKRHVMSMADRLAEQLKASGIPPIGVEGRAQADWILLDVGDVIVHLFRQEVREFYELEKMWSEILPEKIAP